VTVEVRYPDPEPNGLAQMLGGLMEGNLIAHPEREALLARPSTYAIRATDVGVDVSIRLEPGRVIVRNGVVGRPQVVVETDSETLMGLSSMPLKFGLPDVMTKEGREVNRKLMKGQLKVRGLLRHPAKLARLNKLLSVV
jgi:hypothetical protein